MNTRPPAHHLLRRARIAGWAAAVGGTLATLGLIAGITHTASQAATTSGATTSGPTTSTKGTPTQDSPTQSTPTVAAKPKAPAANPNNGLGSANQGGQPQGGSNGS